MAPASAQTHAHNPASYGAYPECVSLRSRPKVPNQDPRAASGPCLLRVPALQERSPRSPVCEARRRRKDPPVLRPPTTTFRFVSAARTNIAGAKAAAAAAARKFRRFIITSSLSLAFLETKQLHHTSIEKLYIRALITHGKITDVRCGVLFQRRKLFSDSTDTAPQIP